MTHASAAGENQFTFNGRLGKRPLGPGSYRLIATPATPHLTGHRRSVTFKITR